MTQQQLNNWLKLFKQYKNGYHMEPSDWQELIRLNHTVMEASHEVHNHNMLNGFKQ